MIKRFLFISKLVLLLGTLSAMMAIQQEPAEPPVPESSASESRVLLIPISDEDSYMVDQVQADFIIEILEKVEEDGYDRVILDIDTYGGVVFAARDITERLLRLNIPTTAYVRTKAISAGAFIAWACTDIVMEERTTIGDAQMVYMTPQGEMKEAPEKSVSVYRSDWEKASDATNRSFALARGFFEADLAVYQVGDQSQWDFMLKTEYEALPEDQRPPLMEVIVEEGKLLTLHAEKAEELGIGTVVPDFDAYLTSEGLSEKNIERVGMDLNYKILRYLGANPWIFFIITLIGLNGIYAEIKAPGFGIPGLTALVCFTIVFGSRYLLGTADSLEILLFFVGIALCFIEIFVTPGVGVMGISGIVLMLASLALASVPDIQGVPDHDIQWDWLLRSTGVTLAAFVGSLITLVVFFPMLFASPLAQRHMLPNEFKPEDGYVVKTVDDEEMLKGQEGNTPSGLRPSGKMKLPDGRLLDVVSDGQFVDAGQRVRIHKVDGNRIVVRPISKS